jgi:hypothetical protein
VEPFAKRRVVVQECVSWRYATAGIEIARIITKQRFLLSSVSIGLGVILPPESCFMMWVGAMIFW